MSNYEESNITLSSQTTIQQTSRHQLVNLSATETRSLFRTLLTTESDQTPQPVTNELDIYFNSNPPGDKIVPLEWWKNHAMEYPVLSKMACVT
jgi:hypothetical protein